MGVLPSSHFRPGVALVAIGGIILSGGLAFNVMRPGFVVWLATGTGGLLALAGAATLLFQVRMLRLQRGAFVCHPIGTLTVEEVRRIHVALIQAFKHDELEVLVCLDMGVRFDTVVAEGVLPKVVLDLIEWAERHGRLRELLHAAATARPKSTELQKLVCRYPYQPNAVAVDPAPAVNHQAT